MADIISVPPSIPFSSIVEQKEETKQKSQAQQAKIEDIQKTLKGISDQMSQADGILEFFPDLQMAREILTAMILSPKDLIFGGMRLGFRGNKYINDKEAHGLLKTVTDYLKTETPLEKQFPEMIDEALFSYGAHIWLMLPPSYLDKFIKKDQVSLESIDSTLEILNHSDDKFLRDAENVKFADKWQISFTQNISYLGLPAAMNTAQAKHSQVGLEAFYGGEQIELIQEFDIPEDERADSAKPLLMKLPMDCVLPIADPANPKHHLLYMVALDERYHPASHAKDMNYLCELQHRMDAARGSSTIEDYDYAKKLGFGQAKGGEQLKDAYSLYVKAMEKMIGEAVKEAGYGKDIEIAEWEGFYRIMLARTLQKKKTRLLLVPPYMIDYLAFDYDKMGIGRSLLRKTAMYSNLRAIVMFSNLIRQLENDIPRKDLDITLDDDDTDSVTTVHNMVAIYGRYMDRAIPSTFSPTILFDELRRSGIRVNVNGGKRLPNSKLDVVQNQTQITPVNTELQDLLKKGQYAGIGVPPELVDPSQSGDFAINTVTSNQMLARRAYVYQTAFKESLIRRIRKYIMLDKDLFSLIEKKYKDKAKIRDFLKSMVLILPQATDTTFEQQYKSFQTYSQMIDEVAASYISDAMLRGVIKADVAQQGIDQLKELAISRAKRQWAIKNDICPELEVLLGDDSKDEDSYAQLSNKDMQAILENLRKILDGVTTQDVAIQNLGQKVRQDAQKKYPAPSSGSADPNNPNGGSGGFGSDTSSGFGSDSSSGGFGSSSGGFGTTSMPSFNS